MADPTQEPDWATDTNYSTGPDAGLPTKETPDPSAGIVAQGFVPGGPLFGPRANWILNLHGRWIDRLREYFNAEEHAYPTPKNRFKWVDGIGLVGQKDYVDTAGALQQVTTGEGWNPVELVVFGPPDVIGFDGAIVDNVPNHWGIRGISHLLTKSMTLINVRFRVHMFTAEATSGERMQVGVYKRNISTGGITTLGTAAIANSTSEQSVDLTPFSDNIDTETFTYFIGVRSSHNCTSVSPDKFMGFRLNYTELAVRTD
jgi:hypothetical protein